MAILAWNHLHNGHGGLDWAGLPLVAAWLGIEDVDGLLHRLMTIKAHRPDDKTIKAHRPDDKEA